MPAIITLQPPIRPPDGDLNEHHGVAHLGDDRPQHRRIDGDRDGNSAQRRPAAGPRVRRAELRLQLTSRLLARRGPRAPRRPGGRAAPAGGADVGAAVRHRPAGLRPPVDRFAVRAVRRPLPVRHRLRQGTRGPYRRPRGAGRRPQRSRRSRPARGGRRRGPRVGPAPAAGHQHPAARPASDPDDPVLRRAFQQRLHHRRGSLGHTGQRAGRPARRRPEVRHRRPRGDRRPAPRRPRRPPDQRPVPGR